MARKKNSSKAGGKPGPRKYVRRDAANHLARSIKERLDAVEPHMPRLAGMVKTIISTGVDPMVAWSAMLEHLGNGGHGHGGR